MDFATDDNNNTPGEKSYSLRPRVVSRRDKEEQDEEEVTKQSRARPRRKQKQKSAPLSKYRRKTANARERSRMREINDAFESLRKSIPHLASTCENSTEKISKIMTLRLAMKYITALANALEQPDTYAADLANFASLNMPETSSFADQEIWKSSSSSSDSFSSLLVNQQQFSRIHDVITKDCQSTRLKPVSVVSTANVSHGSFSHFFNKPDIPLQLVLDKNSTLPSLHQAQTFRPQEIVRQTLTPPEEPSFHIPFEDFQTTLSSTNSELHVNPSLFNPDFDGLPSPVMDFCDLFLT